MADDATPKKSLGQHWLHDQKSLNAMLEAADVQDTDTILEIGPGLGTLTTLLCAKAKEVIAVELDIYLASDLNRKVPAKNLQVVNEDILRFDFASLPPNYKIVANIPYYLTSNLLRTISDTQAPPLSATLLTQKEVAERVAAEPGQMSILSVAVQFFWEVRLGPVVPAELFTPPPKVDSQILTLKRFDPLPYPDADIKQFFHIVRSGFSQKRKTLLNTLSSGLHIDRKEISAICLSVGVDPARRAQTLSLEEWYRVYREISPLTS
jgi:16S rRNA (adenine1518-N6/adenine1519-N6)-dimethyltransferase